MVRRLTQYIFEDREKKVHIARLFFLKGPRSLAPYRIQTRTQNNIMLMTLVVKVSHTYIYGCVCVCVVPIHMHTKSARRVQGALIYKNLPLRCKVKRTQIIYCFSSSLRIYVCSLIAYTIIMVNDLLMCVAYTYKLYTQS